MIVKHTEAGWEIIFQAAHALLAGQIALQLQVAEQLTNWPETLAAIIDHDDLKESFGKNVYLTELGAPKDFTQFSFTADERFTEAKRRIESGHRKHRWIGLLASRHVDELYGTEPVSKKLSALVSDERIRRTTVLKKLGISARVLEESYRVVQWCDRASLILCQGELPAMHRRLEIAELVDNNRYEIWQNDNTSLCVEPWPFRTDGFNVAVECRTLNRLHFANDRELETSLLESAVTERRWRFTNIE